MLTKETSVVIWAADTNYRIDLENPEVRSYATSGNLEPLIEADQVGLRCDDLFELFLIVFVQLIAAMQVDEAFSSYREGPLTFPPTYRYDLHSDEYDTSEKMRIPAWTGTMFIYRMD